MSSFYFFNSKSVKQIPSPKHLGMILDIKLNFQEHLKNVLNKVNKTIGLLWTLQNILPRGPLLPIYKSFIRPHLDNGDVIYDQNYNNSFHDKLESIQDNAVLAITGTIRGSSREKLYQELGLESLQQRRWFRTLCYFFKITKNQSPSICLIKSPPLREHIEEEIMSTTFFGSLSNILFLRTRSYRPLQLSGIILVKVYGVL